MPRDLQPDHPQDVGVPEQDPDVADDEAAHLLVNDAYPRLAPHGFTRDEVFEWVSAYLETDRTGDVEGLLDFIRVRQTHQPG